VLSHQQRSGQGEATMSVRARRLAFVGAIGAILVAGAATASATPRNPGWTHLSSPQAGVSFDFPPLGGKVTYEFTHNVRATRPCGVGDTGLQYVWVESGVPYKNTTVSYLIAGGVSRDFAAGREAGPADIYRWVRQGSGYAVDICGRPQPVTHVIQVIARADGSRALLFDRSFFGDPVDATKDIVAVVDFPRGHSGEYRSITFSFLHSEGITMANIRRVIASVSFSRRTLAGTGSGVGQAAAVGLVTLMVGVMLRAGVGGSYGRNPKPE
jgi:hypothetical protein